MLRPAIASLPRVCHRCTCQLPPHAHVCPNCFVRQEDFTWESVWSNILMVILILLLFAAVGWGLYQFFQLG